MFQLCLPRGFRPCISQTLSLQLVALRNGRAATFASRRLPLRSQEHLYHAARRSFLNEAKKVQSTTLQRTVRSFACSSTDHTEDGKLIYTGSLGKSVLGVKLFSYSSSGFSLCMMPYILLKTGIGVKSLALKVSFCSMIGFFTFLTPVILHLITRGYVVRLYHNHDTDTYTAVTYNVFLMEKKTVFHQRDVRIPGVAQMFTTFYADKKSLLVNPMLFPLPQDYDHLMGYDQPFSFNMDDLDKPDRN